jgi:hypothetical protein
MSSVKNRWLILFLFLATMLLGLGKARAGGGQPQPVLAAEIEHMAHQAVLLVFASLQVMWFLILVVRRRPFNRCQAHFRLMLAVIGGITWATGCCTDETWTELTGVVVLCLSHLVECCMHAIAEARREFMEKEASGGSTPLADV